ncbi:MAG: hypothetical protein ACO310_09970 [Burkholderiaceae bacterium]
MDIPNNSALALSQAIAQRQIGCEEWMRATLAQIARYNPAHLALVSLVDGDTLLASHHHFPVLYRLRLPGPADPPDRLVLAETLHCPFPGQGFAIDLGRTSSGRRPYLVGIDRPSRAVVLAKPDHYCPP